MQSHLRLQSRPSLLATLVVAALALAVLAPNALASQTSPPAAPNFPAAVPQRPGALTGGHAGAVTAALAQQRYYASYGESAPLTANARPVSIATNDGIGTLPFALALAGALIVGIVGTSSFHVLHSRRRAGQPA